MGKNGLVLVDKPKGLTSRKVVDRIMRCLRIRKAGHFGSLDPFATGLLCIGVGQGTKLLPFMQAHQKEYVAIIGFEMATDTDDITGEAIARYPNVEVDIEQASTWLSDHMGWINQLPPEYCAQKYMGKPLYKLKRENKEVNPRPKQVHIERAEILAHDRDWIEVRIVCSRGTYIRSIARDLGASLEVGGYLRSLRRLKSEGFSVENAHTLEDIEAGRLSAEDMVIPLVQALHIPKVRVTRTGEIGILEGRPIQVSWVIDDIDATEESYIAMMNENNQLLCVARVQRKEGIIGYIERGFTPF
ncbi:MAG: tRNA pseudouridine(55) synthase TruB [Deltaproteobacteria bacterium]|nr:tRNA pseudouridine(55) synthase TruB [Deltaproteobacteria bacterium]